MPEEPYTLRILRVDLESGDITEELIDGETTAKYVGGTGLAMKYLWEEVPAGVKWSDPENRLTFFTGPLAGTRMPGSGTFSVTTLGACTEMCGTAQANGFLGAFMRHNGIDGIIVQGAAEDLDAPSHPGRPAPSARGRTPTGPGYLGDRGGRHQGDRQEVHRL